MSQERYCLKCKEWVTTETLKCPKCDNGTYATRAITDPKEVDELLKANPEFASHKAELVEMIAESGAILDGHFLVEDDQG